MTTQRKVTIKLEANPGVIDLEWLQKKFIPEYMKNKRNNGPSTIPFNGWVLDYHLPFAVNDISRWGRWFDWAARTDKRYVASTKLKIVQGYWVSTVFLGLDYSFTSKLGPMLFETMVFSDADFGLGSDRYATWDQAKKGHYKILNELRLSLWRDYVEVIAPLLMWPCAIVYLLLG